MKYQNPILRGMYPDPSVCSYEGKYYMVCSTFQYFPGVPVFESEDMVNWKKIGHCLTRPSQIELDGVRSSGGVFAPTIRCRNGRFYMVTTNDSVPQNFYVYTDDIYGEWSEPITVDQDGIDPSLFFEGEHTYFISNGSDENGVGSIQMCEIDIATGQKLTPSKILWQGTGGRYLESPHLYRFGEYYYLVEAEGGTEYGHMANYARSKSIWGPYEPYPHNPVLTNRNLGGYPLQAAGHGDIVEDAKGNWWFVHLAFRQIGQYDTFHHLGRETCLVPLNWQEDGWFTLGTDGTARLEMEAPQGAAFQAQKFLYQKDIHALSEDKEWLFLRIPVQDNYRFEKDRICLAGTAVTLREAASPTFTCIRQTEFAVSLTCDILPGRQESGVSIYMDEKHRYELVVTQGAGRQNGENLVFVRQTIGCVSQESSPVVCKEDAVSIRITADAKQYHFYLVNGQEQIHLADADTRYLSSEVAMGFTGVMIGLYAVNPDRGSGETAKEWTCFENLTYQTK